MDARDSGYRGWWFLSAGIILFLLLPSIRKVSWIMFGGFAEIGITLTILGLGMMGALGSPQVPLKIAGWLARFFAPFVGMWLQPDWLTRFMESEYYCSNLPLVSGCTNVSFVQSELAFNCYYTNQ